MPTMILKMSLATVIYVAVTAITWRFWHHHRHRIGMKILIGLFFGACSIASTHLGIDYETMLLNVRDMGPLAAGLFFDPVSGIIAGTIGGVERYIAGDLWGIGSFTKLACSLSTILAGFLPLILHRWIYRGSRPTLIQSYLAGAVMEVFHMYVVLISHRHEMEMAFSVVRSCSVPMILFTAVGMAACSGVVKLLSSESAADAMLKPPSKTPISLLFQRWLLVILTLLFSVSSWMGYSFQKAQAIQAAVANMDFITYSRKFYYEQNRNLSALIALMDEQDANDLVFYILYEKDGRTIRSSSFDTSVQPSESEMAAIRKHTNGDPFFTRLESLYGSEYICTYTRVGDYYLLLYKSTQIIYENETNSMYETILSDILIFAVLYNLIAVLVNGLVVRKLASVNKSLGRITTGHLDEVVDVRSSAEFSVLSDDINQTVTALRGYIDAAEKRMKEELTLAATIQEAALPRVFTFPRNDFSIYALMTPARQVGGDFYDFFHLDSNHLALVIADVSGKGVPAALFMMRSKTAIKNFARSGYKPGKILASVNNLLCEGNDAEMFVTVWIGIVDLTTGLMRCANAGHEYPVLMRSGGEYELVKDKHGLVLAAMSDIPMKDYELQLNPGDRLFVYTDGVPEAINEAKEQYGTGRLLAKLNTLRDESEEATLKAVLADIRAFADGVEQFDDITMLGFTYRGPEQHSPS